AGPIRALDYEASVVPETAMDALLADEPDEAVELANEARNQIRDVDEKVREVDKVIHEYDPQLAQVLGLVADSLSRTADYGGNIAESALQKAAPSP
ncbi:MAG: histidine kinase, partial [Haloarculaceae archaeon]